MRRVLLAAVLLLAVPTLARADTVESTSYCLRGKMADGTYTRLRSAASNRHPLGTRIYILDGNTRRHGAQKGPGGLRRWVIRDRIGSGSSLDFWQPSCGQALAWGRRTVTYRLGWARP